MAELWDTTSLENTMILHLMTQTTPQTRQREPYPTVYPFLKEDVSATETLKWKHIEAMCHHVSPQTKENNVKPYVSSDFF